jgi:hypothetical protein
VGTMSSTNPHMKFFYFCASTPQQESTKGLIVACRASSLISHVSRRSNLSANVVSEINPHGPNMAIAGKMGGLTLMRASDGGRNSHLVVPTGFIPRFESIISKAVHSLLKAKGLRSGRRACNLHFARELLSRASPALGQSPWKLASGDAPCPCQPGKFS